MVIDALADKDRNRNMKTVHRKLLAFMKKVSLIAWNNLELECGPMPNLMVALPNIGGALCSTPQSLADAHY